MAAQVVVVGASNMDLISYVDRLPAVGETLHGHKFATGFGGKGANQCVQAAKLGAATAMVAKVGSDTFGADMLANFKAHNVDTSHVGTVAGVSSGVAPIAVDAAGRNAIIVVNGANDHLSPADVASAADALLSGARVVVTQLEVAPATTLAALEAAHQRGVLSIFNPAPARADLGPAFFTLPTVFCCNEPEGELLAGVAVTDVASATACAQALRARGARTVIVTLGARGALLMSDDVTVHVPGLEVKAVDTTGAGDSFLGALSFFMACRPQLSMAEMVARSNEVAAMSVQKPGTQSSYPAASEVRPGLLD